jgi:hypothetical protein
MYHPGGGGGGVAPRLSEAEPVAVRVVEVAIGAAVWVAKAVEVVEVRWSELPPRPRLAFFFVWRGFIYSKAQENQKNTDLPLVAGPARPSAGSAPLSQPL